MRKFPIPHAAALSADCSNTLAASLRYWIVRIRPSSSSAVSGDAPSSSGVTLIAGFICRIWPVTCRTNWIVRLTVRHGRPAASRAARSCSSHCSPTTNRKSSLPSSRLRLSALAASSARLRAASRMSAFFLLMRPSIHATAGASPATERSAPVRPYPGTSRS